ncbi:MAG: hypothetical protein KDJ31_09005 [Candidatus Competibacteraceae bacterium]|nr:hypothetical protein [Candidatus Competibacteraceae bacterium]
MHQIHPDLLRSGDATALQAAEALIRALTQPEWPENRLKLNSRMARKTLTVLQSYLAVSEVRDYLADLARKNYRTNSRQWHYFRYKYLF